MNRKSWWIVSISVAVVTGAIGCGGSSSTGGMGGSGGTAAAGSGGRGGTTGGSGGGSTGAAGTNTGTAGTTGAAGTGGGAGATVGNGGQTGMAGATGRGGANGTAGRGGGGTVGTGGQSGAAGGAGAGGIGGGAGGTGGTVNCSPGAACTGTETCSAPCAGGMREIACFCAPNSLFACEACLPGTGGSGADAGVPACPANPMGMDCTTAGSTCETTCTGGMAQACMCQVSTGGGTDGGPAMRWRCQNVRCQ